MPDTDEMQGDAGDIQTLFVAALHRLLSHDTPESEWRFELGAIRHRSGDQWEHRNAFLFSHTIARFCAALEAHLSEPAAVFPTTSFDPPDVTEFVARFTEAVRINDSVAALAVWAGEVNRDRSGYGPTQVASMFALYDHLRSLSKLPELDANTIAGAVDELPDPFGEDVWLEPVPL